MTQFSYIDPDSFIVKFDCKDDMTRTVEKLQSHLFVLQDQISLLETKHLGCFGCLHPSSYLHRGD